MGMERELTGSLRLRLNEKNINAITDMAALLPVRTINSFSYQIVESGPCLSPKVFGLGFILYKSSLFTLLAVL